MIINFHRFEQEWAMICILFTSNNLTVFSIQQLLNYIFECKQIHIKHIYGCKYKSVTAKHHWICLKLFSIYLGKLS